jgi:hypothetical protein
MEGRMADNNEELGVKACLNNPDFRKVLMDIGQDPVQDKLKVSKALDDIKLTFKSDADKQAAVEIIVYMNWSQLKELENALLKGTAQPAMG